MDVKAKIEELLPLYLNEDQFFIVDIQVTPSRNRAKITILLDSDTGITIDECADISRRLGNQLEELEVFDGGAFTLEVSSPGIDQPLTLLRQYRKNIGRDVAILQEDGQIRKGKLEDATDQKITILETPAKKAKKQQEAGDSERSGLIEIPLSDIKKATVQVSFK